MSGAVRNRQVVKIAGVLGLILLLVYLFLSWQASLRAQTAALDDSKREYNDLFSKHNKLTEELKYHVKMKADTQLELEKAKEHFKKQQISIESQLKSSNDQIEKLKLKLQEAENQRDRLQTENEQYELDKQSTTATMESLHEELDSLNKNLAQSNSQQQKCQSDLEALRADLLRVQNSNFASNDRMAQLETELQVAKDAFQGCQLKIKSLDADVTNKQAEINQLRMDSYKSQAIPSQNNPRSHNSPLNREYSIMDTQRQKTMQSLREKIMKGQPLTEQEEQAFLLMNKNANIETVPKNNIPIENAPPIPSVNQQPPPPGPRGEEEQVEDLVAEKNRRDEENLDNKQDEGGADGGGEDDPPDDYNKEEFIDHDNPQEQYEINGRKDGDQPLPNPVRAQDKPENIINFPDGFEELDEEEALRRDQDHMMNEWHEMKKRQDTQSDTR